MFTSDQENTAIFVDQTTSKPQKNIQSYTEYVNGNFFIYPP